MTTHTLKIDTHPYVDLLSGAKTCEIRNDDRGFEIGDKVVLVGTDGGAIERTISHIQRGYGLPDCLCVLSYAPVAAPSPVPKLVRYGFVTKKYATDGFHEKQYFERDPQGSYVFASEAERIIADLVKENARWKSECFREAELATDMAHDRNDYHDRAEIAEAKLAVETTRRKDAEAELWGCEAKLAEIEKPVPSAEVKLAAIALAERSGMDNCNEYDLFIDDVAKTIMRFAINATLEQEPEPDLKVWIKVDENNDGSQEITITEATGFSETPDGEYLLIRPNAHPVADREAETIEPLRKALRFYADVRKYPAPLTGGMGDLWTDCGETARLALSGKEPA